MLGHGGNRAPVCPASDGAEIVATRCSRCSGTKGQGYIRESECESERGVEADEDARTLMIHRPGKLKNQGRVPPIENVKRFH